MVCAHAAGEAVFEDEFSNTPEFTQQHRQQPTGEHRVQTLACQTQDPSPDRPGDALWDLGEPRAPCGQQNSTTEEVTGKGFRVLAARFKSQLCHLLAIYTTIMIYTKS